MHPLGFLLTLVFAFIVWGGNRHTAVAGIFASVCYLTQGQAISLGFNFTAVRIILLVGLFRVLARKENRDWEFNVIDRCMFAYALCILIVFTIRNGTVAAFVYQVGFAYNLILSYFVFRSLLPTMEDFKAVLPRLAMLLIPFAFFIVYEAATGRDVFAVFGGVDANAWAREGHFRARASFRSPITAGGLGAALLPLFAGGYLAGLDRRKMITGMLACATIVLASHSSGPLMALVAGIVGLSFWQMRYRMRQIRWALLLLIVGLHLAMKVPVWFLIGRMGELVGGDAYYRAGLIDAFVKHFSSWWLMGTGDTNDWMPTQLNGAADITNQLVAAGVDGGLLAVLLFVLLMGKCFQRLGIARAMAEGHSREDEWIIWGMGASLFAHITNQTSVTYFDQMHVIWFMSLALIAATVINVRHGSETLDMAETASLIEPPGTNHAVP